MAGKAFMGWLCALCMALPAVVCAHSDAGAFAGGDVAATAVAAQDAGPQRYAAQVRVDPREVIGVVLKVNARIVALRDIYPGRSVKQGEVLAEFESAELETIQRTYAETFANLELVKAFSTTAEEKLIEGQMNLQWRGLSEEDVRTLEDTRTPVRRVGIRAPQDGYVVDVAITEGQVINPGAQSGLFSLSGTTLFRIADPEAFLVEAELPLAQARDLKPEDTVWLHLSPTAAPLEALVEEVVPLTGVAGMRRTVRLRPLASASLLGLRDGQRLTVSLDAEEEAHAH